MKKVTILMAGALLAAGFSACTQAPKANIQSKNDSLSYYVGMSNAQGVKSYITERMDIDSVYMDEVIRGIVEGAGRTSKKDVAYLTGISIGQQISNLIVPSLNEQIFAGDSTQALNAKNFLAGFLDGAVEKGGAMAFDEARIYADKLVEEAQEASLRKINADYIAELMSANADRAYVEYLAAWFAQRLEEENAIREANGEEPYDVDFTGEPWV